VAERQVLSQMLGNVGVAMEIARGEYDGDEGSVEVNEEFFGNDTYKTIYLAMCDLAERANSPLDSFTVCSRALKVAKERKIKSNVNIQLIEELRKTKSEGTLYGSLVALQERKYLRELMLASAWAMQNAKPDANVRDLISEYIEKIMRVLPLAQSDRALEGNMAVQHHMEVMRKRIEARKAGKLIELDYPWESWRKMILPQIPGKYMSLIIPHGQGKSTYCGNIAEWRAVNKIPTITILMEDTKEAFWDRSVARWSNIPLGDIRGGKFDAEQELKYEYAMKKIGVFAVKKRTQVIGFARRMM